MDGAEAAVLFCLWVSLYKKGPQKFSPEPQWAVLYYPLVHIMDWSCAELYFGSIHAALASSHCYTFFQSIAEWH